MNCHIASYPMTYIHCPDCDAVRTTDAAACPECGRCANCGAKIAKAAQNCECGFPADEKLAKWIESRYGIPEASVEREKAKWERRKRLEPYKLAGRIALLAACLVLGLLTAVILLAGSHPITQVVLAVPVVCLLVLFYWVFFYGLGRILLWVARKMGIGS
jgi:hypothetical protein